MNILKKFALGVCASVLISSLFGFGVAFGLLQTLGNPDSIKTALKESGFYQTFVGYALDQAQKKQGSEGGGGDQIPIDRPEVKNVIKNAVSPELLQRQVEGSLDSVYAWLQGKTPKLEFVIKLDEAKVNLANGLSEYAEDRLASLPTCPAGTQSSKDVDPFSASCLPKGVKPSQVAREAKNEVLNGDFLKDPTLSANDIKNDNGKTIEEQLQAVPTAYKVAKWTTIGTGILALLMAVAVVFLSVNWRSGVKKASITFIVIGALFAGMSWLLGYGITRAIELATEPLQQSGVKVGQHLANNLRAWWLWYGVGLIVVGVIKLLVLHFTKPKTPSEPAGKPAAPADKNESTAFAVPTTAKPKPKSPRRLVQ